MDQQKLIHYMRSLGDGCDRCHGLGYTGNQTPHNGPITEVRFCSCKYGVHLRAQNQERLVAEQQRRLNQVFVNAGIPERYSDLTIETLRERSTDDADKLQAIEAVQAFVNDGFLVDQRTGKAKTSVILTGEPGMGKTGLMTAVLRSYLEQGRSALWVELYDFLDQIRQGYNDGTATQRMEQAQRADVVLLDDFGDADRSGPETDDRRRLVYQFINWRHNNGLPTLITTNLTGQGLAEQFGARTFERIVEMCYWIKVGGKNLRFEP